MLHLADSPNPSSVDGHSPLRACCAFARRRLGPLLGALVHFRYARQAKLVTRQQLSLHEELEEVSYMAKLALSACTKAKAMMSKHVQDAKGLHDLKQDIAALRHAINQTRGTLKKLENALPPD